MKVTRFLAGLVLVGGMALSGEVFAQEAAAPRLRDALSQKQFSKFCGNALIRVAAAYDKNPNEKNIEALQDRLEKCAEFLTNASDVVYEVSDELSGDDGDGEPGDEPAMSAFGFEGKFGSELAVEPDTSTAEPMPTREPDTGVD